MSVHSNTNAGFDNVIEYQSWAGYISLLSCYENPNQIASMSLFALFDGGGYQKYYSIKVLTKACAVQSGNICIPLMPPSVDTGHFSFPQTPCWWKNA